MWYTIAAQAGDELAAYMQRQILEKNILSKAAIEEAKKWAEHRETGQCSVPKSLNLKSLNE